MATNDATQITPVKHINNKTAKVDPSTVLTTKQPVFMIRMFGIIQSVKNFEDRRSNDMKTVFIGDFRATGPKGEVYESDKLFAFKSLEEKLVGEFRSGGEKAIEFGYDIFALPDDKSATKYSYQAKSIIKTVTNDHLAALSQLVGSVVLPTTEPETDAAPEAETAVKTKAKK